MKIHLIGICGSAMGQLAGLLAAAGHEVRGSDDHAYPPVSTQLEQMGIPMFVGFRPENLDWGPERVVVGNVCRKDHVEVVAATARGLSLTSFPALLSELFLATPAEAGEQPRQPVEPKATESAPRRRSLVVAGTHGKTTTSSLLAFVLSDAGRDPSFLVGGVPINFGVGFRFGNGPHFVVEGDEYDTAFFDKGPKFLHYKPEVAILTGVELDHIDIYSSLDALKDAFRRFVDLIPSQGKLVVGAAFPHALEVARAARCPVETYAVGREADWTGRILEERSGGRMVFEVNHHGQWFATMESGLLGDYNLENILAVVAATHHLGLGTADIARAIRRFAGVKRRQEIRGVASGVTVMDDFAHHPTAVRETLRALRRRYARGKIVAVFEPRSATSRRKVFQQDFAEAFSQADEVVVAPPFAAEKLPEGERLDAEQLAADLRMKGVRAKCVTGGVADIVGFIVERVAPGDTVVVMSSGAFGNIHEKLLDGLGDAVMSASQSDRPAVEELLLRVSLPITGVGEHLHDFQVLKDGGQLVGCVGLELYDEAGILRSLAVVPERRGQGLGWMLADQAVARARARGVRRLYLLTESASDFFAQHFGFRVIGHEAVEPPVNQSSEFVAGLKRGATCMRFEL